MNKPDALYLAVELAVLNSIYEKNIPAGIRPTGI